MTGTEDRGQRTEISSSDSRAGGEPVSSSPGPPGGERTSTCAFHRVGKTAASSTMTLFTSRSNSTRLLPANAAREQVVHHVPEPGSHGVIDEEVEGGVEDLAESDQGP